ncbi:helix-turn-helix transcriptional regulator [Acinetobacter sp. UBA801]|uniref:helix-turn-helix transcriptional regulator n=1 Tax=Acinetobacter sp. UBA801 TaxID=1945958 RepID=UPI0025C71FD8|nr:transcriptional regulator [Acinetobacter sp. UBA801]
MLSQDIIPLQISYKKACQMLDVSRDTLRVLIRRDPSFPKPIKYGETRQAPVFFSYAELVEWHNKRKMQS